MVMTMKEGLVKALTEKVDTAEMIVNAFARRLQDRNSNRGRTLMDSQSVFEAVATVQVFGEAIRQINLGMEFETLQQFFMDQLLVAARHPDRLPKSDACRMFATETMNASANCLAEICDWPY